MESDRFDSLARWFGQRSSRRAVTRQLGAALGAGVLALAGKESADAFICRNPGVRCGLDAQCCSGHCDTGSTWRCLCPDENDTVCDGDCVDLSSDTDHCGGCDTVCPDQSGIPQCIDGSCCQGQIGGSCAAGSFDCCFPNASCQNNVCCSVSGAGCFLNEQCCSGTCNRNPLAGLGSCA